MMRFYAAVYTTAVTNLERADSLLTLAAAFNASTEEQEQAKMKFKRHLSELAEEVQGLPLSPSFQSQVERLQAASETDPIAHLQVRIQELRSNLINEMAAHLFLCVPSSNKWLFLEPEKDYWTVEVCDAFADARQDLRECARCLALGMWTASVFHGMRSVQHGLHRLADRLGVTFTRDIDVLNWNEILQGIEKKLKQMANQPKTPARDAEILFGSSASSHFFGIKEAWRNYVMHGRSTYDEPQAHAIAANVRSILKALA